ncbi:MAG TPA: DUF192 domain-containing protein [Acidimicrobiia bacterium]|jgi:hypothetical protein|nr:DUF192 domain-containing protein [Acidimicrobiia bacterium]
MTWLVRDDDVLAVAEIAGSRSQRTRGLMGRDDFEGALVLRPCRQVHTFGMRFPIDVAFCDRAGVVLHLSCLAPRRMSRVVWRSAFVIEARSGSFERWKLQLGDLVEIKG